MMTRETPKLRRRSVRIIAYNYGQAGAYFVTVCAADRACLFGAVVNDRVELTRWGQVVAEEWERTVVLRPRIRVDAFVLMPNHIHGILVIVDDGTGSGGQSSATGEHGGVTTSVAGRGTPPEGGTRALQRAPAPLSTTGVPAGRGPTQEAFGRPTSDSIPTIVRLFKAATTARINGQRGTPGAPVWQRGYYEHVIRSEDEWNRARKYIADNPLRWALDRENPLRLPDR